MRLRNLDALARSMRDEVSALEVGEAVEEMFSQYRDDPVRFVQEVLGGESATLRSTGRPYQFDILRDLVVHARAAIRSGHGVGKSTLDAWAAIWWLLTRPYSRVIIVAPEFSRQVRAVLFGEIRKWVRRAKVELPVQVLANRVTIQGFGDEWAAIGLPATEPHRIEGFHSEAGVLLILDETKGVPNDVYDALMGALTGKGENRLLVTSTPGAPAGIFYKIFTQGRDDWQLHHIPSTDSSMVSEEWISQRRREWGEGSPLFQARVLGEFPQEEDGTLIRLSDLEAAVGRELEQDGEDPPDVTLGVDCARFGADLSAIAIWRGNTLERIETRQGMDTMQVAAWVSSAIHRTGARRVRVDEIGLGAGVVDRLRQMGHEVEGINVGRAASDPQLHANLRSELFWTFREQLEKGEISLPDDEGLLAEISALRFDYTQTGQIRIEKKEAVKKRLGKSPDLADSAVLGLPIPNQAMGRYGLIGGRVFDFVECRVVPRSEWATN